MSTDPTRSLSPLPILKGIFLAMSPGPFVPDL